MATCKLLTQNYFILIFKVDISTKGKLFFPEPKIEYFERQLKKQRVLSKFPIVRVFIVLEINLIVKENKETCYALLRKNKNNMWIKTRLFYSQT